MRSLALAMPKKVPKRLAKLRHKLEYHRPPSDKDLPRDGEQHISIPTERRRLQNRTAQRKYRRSPDQTLSCPKRQDAAAAEWYLPLNLSREGDGLSRSLFKDFDPGNKSASHQLVKGVIAWPSESIRPRPNKDGSFQYARIGVSGPAEFFMWGMIELHAGQSKHLKISKQMHIVFNVLEGAVKVKVHENEFTVHEGEVWQVPRGNNYNIQYVSGDIVRIFYAQARDTSVDRD